MYLCRVLAILIISSAAHSREFHSDTQTTMEIIFNDIQTAFRMVSNNTNLLATIIPKMYDMPATIASNSCLHFKVPHRATGYSVVTMPRWDFQTPVFPNITTDDMSAAIKKRRPTKELNQKLVEASPLNANIWNSLGLNGWTGDISQPTQQLLDQKHNNTTVEADKKFLTANELAKMDENIFIARVNDPFGQSTKWELRNQLSNKTEDRSKRDVITLYSMIRCSTGCDPLVYKGYGCYCGFLGHGIPVNGIDRCCKLHDKCYEQSNCISYLEYFVPYVWKCYRGTKPICAIDHGEWGGPHSCAARLCYCDLRLSRCLRKYTCPRRRTVCASSKSRRLQNLLFFK